MKTALVLFSVVSVAGFAASASDFDKHFGNYSVISIDQIISGDCPVKEATISRKVVGGYEGIILEASGETSTNEYSCSVQTSVGLSVQGLPGVTCTESADQIVCIQGDDRIEISANETKDGVLTLRMISTGRTAADVTSILRRK